MRFKKAFLCLALLIFCFGQFTQIASALSDKQKKLLNEYVNYYNVEICSTDGPARTTSINLENVAKEYNLQSAIVKEVGGNELGSFNPDESPKAPASVLKMLIADVVLHKNVDLAKSVTIESKQIYSAGDATAGQSIKLKEVLDRTLSETSWDTGANILIDEAGGFKSITDAAHELGYRSTDIVNYYHDPPPKPFNSTTVTDLTKAMEDIFTSKGADFEAAQAAMTGENHFNIHPTPDASKWGGTSLVTGNSGLFQIDKKQYVITLYINDSHSKNPDSEAFKGVKEASETIVKLINGSSPDASTTTGCCPPEGSTTLKGRNNPEKIWNYFIDKGLTNIQVAAIMGNLQQESGFNPLANNPSSGAFGIGQWYQGRKDKLIAKPNYKDLSVQLDYMWEELNGSYKITVLQPLKKAADLSTAVLVWLEHYEVPCLPGHCQAELATRVPFAKAWLNRAGGGAGSNADATAEGSAGSCGGTSGSVEGYKNPYRDLEHVTPMRIDMGVDYAGAGYIYAIGKGKVNVVHKIGGGSGWPGPNRLLRRKLRTLR
jgi:hypothetical protein